MNNKYIQYAIVAMLCAPGLLQAAAGPAAGAALGGSTAGSEAAPAIPLPAASPAATRPPSDASSRSGSLSDSVGSSSPSSQQDGVAGPGQSQLDLLSSTPSVPPHAANGHSALTPPVFRHQPHVHISPMPSGGELKCTHARRCGASPLRVTTYILIAGAAGAVGGHALTVYLHEKARVKRNAEVVNAFDLEILRWEQELAKFGETETAATDKPATTDVRSTLDLLVLAKFGAQSFKYARYNHALMSLEKSLKDFFVHIENNKGTKGKVAADMVEKHAKLTKMHQALFTAFNTSCSKEAIEEQASWDNYNANLSAQAAATTLLSQFKAFSDDFRANAKTVVDTATAAGSNAALAVSRVDSLCTTSEDSSKKRYEAIEENAKKRDESLRELMGTNKQASEAATARVVGAHTELVLKALGAPTDPAKAAEFVPVATQLTGIKDASAAAHKATQGAVREAHASLHRGATAMAAFANSAPTPAAS